jgi:hypothetical protein
VEKRVAPLQDFLQGMRKGIRPVGKGLNFLPIRKNFPPLAAMGSCAWMSLTDMR